MFLRMKATGSQGARIRQGRAGTVGVPAKAGLTAAPGPAGCLMPARAARPSTVHYTPIAILEPALPTGYPGDREASGRHADVKTQSGRWERSTRRA